jgi:chromosome partitioning protein
MHVIVLASRKGGAGKTTLARHLAVEAIGEGGSRRVALIDSDPMGGLAKWWNRRQAETPDFIQTDPKSIPTNAERLRKAGYGYLFIDSPPAVTDAVRAVVRLADLVVVPARPSPDDLDAIGQTIDLVEGEGRPMVFVVNGATKRARLTGQAAVNLSQHGTVAPAIIHHSTAVPESAVVGQVVRETKGPDSPSAQEIAELWAYLDARLRKSEAAVGRVNKRAS